VILVDDGSRDRSGELCDWYVNLDSRIRVVHKENGGLSSARNAGLDLATGNYVGFIDSDDWIAEEMYGDLLCLMEQTRSDIAACGCLETGDLVRDVPQQKGIVCYESKAIIRNFLYEGALSLPGAYSVCRNLYRRDLFMGIRFPVGKLCEDMSTNYKILSRAQRMVVSQQKMYYYFQGGSSISRAGLRVQHFDLFEMCAEISVLASDETDQEIKRLVEVLLARCHFSILAKIAYYGIADSILDRDKLIQHHTQELRKKYNLLMQAQIPFSRKAMISLLCIHFKLLEVPLTAYKWTKERAQ
jgi:glycosyltransferase involved in cell wall biosynthesis